MVEELHRYEYDIDLDGPSAQARLVRLVGHGRRVLELGAGPGSITRILKAQDCRVTALEIDGAALEKLRPHCECAHQVDLNSPDWPDFFDGTQLFDVVVAADVLEHVKDPLATLQAMKALVSEDGCVVVSLPHFSYHGVISCLLGENYERNERGILDCSHVHFYCLKNIQALFEDAGLGIVEAEFVVVPPDETEFAKQWRSLPRAVRRMLKEANPFGLVYQVVVRAVPDDRAGEAVLLMSQPVRKAPPVYRAGQPLRNLARRFLSTRIRRWMKRVLTRDNPDNSQR